MTTAPRAAPEVLAQLERALEVARRPLLEVAPALHETLLEVVPHTALVVFTEACSGRPRKKAGDRAITDAATIEELVRLRSAMAAAGEQSARRPGVLAGQQRPLATWSSPTGAVLVLVDPGPGDDALVGALWEIAAVSIQHQVAGASPSYLADSRAIAGERTRLVHELTDEHATTLEALLASLRSRSLDDTAARRAATEVATNALIALRTESDRQLSFTLEPVVTAFARLKRDLRPLARFGGVDVQFVEPPTTGRALPGEVAHAARAVVRSAVLALVDHGDVGRVRVQWDCDGTNLLIDLRDDGAGDLTRDDDSLAPILERVAALDGTCSVASTAGWGSEIVVTLPLDLPRDSPALPIENLTVREREILQLVAAGDSNAAIAGALAISANTVKFHVANLLRKLGARNRAELARGAR